MQEERVLEANQRFYEALEKLDLAAMEAVWLHEGWVKCVHPGWELLEGWEEIRESWSRIFAHTRRMRVGLGSVSVKMEERIAWVCCLEQITSSFERGFDTAWAQATNIFVEREGRWLMVHHHASPIPRPEAETVH
ncbi:MAG: nuclear transport factor 2 family protein [Terriglobia bacterium]